MGHVFANEIQMKDSMDVIKSLAAKENFTDRERLHVEAVKALSAGWDANLLYLFVAVRVVRFWIQVHVQYQ